MSQALVDLLHPSLGFSAAYCFNPSNDRVTLTVDSIYNPREASNLSGTLSLELWALPSAYDGGDFHDGHPLAGACIGSIGGQQNWTQLSYDLPLSAPPSGSWIITLMLREWTGLGYTTRSHVNFPLAVTFPYNSTATLPPPATPPETTAPAPVATVATPKKPARKTKAPSAKVIAPAAAATPVADARLALNRASAKELAAVDGISATLAKALVAARPFSRFDDLLKVKGVTAKLLAKIQPALRID